MLQPHDLTRLQGALWRPALCQQQDPDLSREAEEEPLELELLEPLAAPEDPLDQPPSWNTTPDGPELQEGGEEMDPPPRHHPTRRVDDEGARVLVSCQPLL